MGEQLFCTKTYFGHDVGSGISIRLDSQLKNALATATLKIVCPPSSTSLVTLDCFGNDFARF